MRKELTDFVKERFDSEIIQTNLKFDYEGFLRYIKTDAVEHITEYLREIDITKSDDLSDLIVNSAVQYSSSLGQKDSEEIAKKLILNILDIVKSFYISKVETAQITVWKEIANQSIKTITEHSDKNKEEMIECIQLSNFANNDKNSLTYPPEHLNSEVYGFRKDVVSRIIEKINLGERRVFLTGIGGVGKTTIAKDLYHKLKDQYKNVAWIPYQENLSDSILSSFSLFLDIKDKRLEMIANFLVNKNSDLLIFIDNVTNDILDDKMLKTFAGMDATVLLTTRLTNISAFNEHKIDFLNKEQAIEVFYLYYKYDKEKVEKEIVAKLVELTACHTLTVELLAKGANVPGTNIKSYYDNLVKKGFGFSNAIVKTSHNEISQTIATHLRLLYDISAVTHNESRILQIFSFLPSVTMPASFSGWIQCDSNELVHLSELGWLNASQEGYFMHQVIRDAIQLNNCNKNYLDVFVKLILEDKFFNKAENYIETRLKLQVAKAVIEYYTFSNDVELAQVYVYIGISEKDQGEYEKALEFYNKVYICFYVKFGENHPSAQIIYHNAKDCYALSNNDEIGFDKWLLKNM